ncbi:uncharacterized protein LOC126778036 [Nymphalis io]|uniref:uncharacterized protein LOC126778036 n=1 Tax=Inachis io TaxID=171585 RepID=UPI0021679608|nr:uncharacterized protein LOC126778036 [Nymphalis io]
MTKITLEHTKYLFLARIPADAREDNESPISGVGSRRAEKPLNYEELWRQLIEKQNQNMMALISTLRPHESSRRFTLPEFKPDKEESDARSWCATVNICFEDNPPRGGQLIVVISKALKGTASSWLSHMSYPGISWPEFKDLFTARFISTDTCAGTLINLNSEKLKDNESLAACASRIITSLMSRWKDCTKEQIAVATALAHISQHDSRLQRLAFTTEITSRQQLQKELQAFSYQKRKAPAAEALSTTDSKRAKFYKQPTLKCFGCGKLGHRQAECRSKPKNYKPKSPVKTDVASTSHRVEKSTSIRCFKCGVLGHVASRCTAGTGSRGGNTSASTSAERRVDLCVVEPPTGYLQHRD